MLSVLIVDDEAPARLRLRRLVEKQDELVLVGECRSGEEAVRAIRAERPDLVFLDIQMRRLDGFAVLRQLGLPPEDSPVCIFVTAYDQYAVQAFEENAVDYLLKPFSDERFALSVDRARRQIHQREVLTYTDRLRAVLHESDELPRTPALAPTSAAEVTDVNDTDAGDADADGMLMPAGRIVLKTGSRLVFVDPGQVDWVEAEGVYVRLHVGGKSHLIRESLTNVEERLNGQHFLRIHRSTIVNVDRIKEVVPHFNGGAIVRLQDGTQLKLSRSYRSRIAATFG